VCAMEGGYRLFFASLAVRACLRFSHFPYDSLVTHRLGTQIIREERAPDALPHLIDWGNQK